MEGRSVLRKRNGNARPPQSDCYGGQGKELRATTMGRGRTGGSLGGPIVQNSTRTRITRKSPAMLSNEPDPDVLVIGAGPTGAVAAKRFVSAGMRVVVLEQGDWPDYSKARANHPDFELTAGRNWS